MADNEETQLTQTLDQAAPAEDKAASLDVQPQDDAASGKTVKKRKGKKKRVKKAEAEAEAEEAPQAVPPPPVESEQPPEAAEQPQVAEPQPEEQPLPVFERPVESPVQVPEPVAEAPVEQPVEPEVENVIEVPTEPEPRPSTTAPATEPEPVPLDPSAEPSATPAPPLDPELPPPNAEGQEVAVSPVIPLATSPIPPDQAAVEQLAPEQPVSDQPAAVASEVTVNASAALVSQVENANAVTARLDSVEDGEGVRTKKQSVVQRRDLQEERKKRLDELLALDGYALRAAAFDYATIGKVYDQLSLVDSFGFLMEPTSRLYGAIETLRDTVKVAKVTKTNTDDNNQEEIVEEELKPLPKPVDPSNNDLKREVLIRMVILKVSDISTITEVFTADVFMQAKWREPILDGATADQLKSVNFGSYWKPQLFFDNIYNEQKDTSTYAVETDATGSVWMFEKRRVKGVFLQQLNLMKYPFDCQDLTLTVTSEDSVAKLTLAQDMSEPTTINARTSVEQQEWVIHEHVDVATRVMVQEYSNSARERSVIDFTCRASRKPRYFFFNVFVISAFITSLAFGSFSVKNYTVGSIATRLTLTFTLILTTVTFKMVVNMLLPKVSYLTSMDKYLLMGLITLVSLSAWHAMAANISTLYSVELYVACSIASIYILCNCIFFIWVYASICEKRRWAFRKDKEYKKWLKDTYGNLANKPVTM